MRKATETSLGANGSLADSPFTAGVLSPDDPYRDDPAFSEEPPDAAGDLVTFADLDGDGFYDADTEMKFDLDPAVISADDVARARANEIPSGEWVVLVKLNEAGAGKLGVLTAEAIGRQVAAVVDGLVVAAPVVQERVTSGDVQIAGRFTEADATDLAERISPST